MPHTARFRQLVLLIANSPLVSDLGMIKLWKLIYFIDTALLRSEDRSLTESEFIKYPHGPVPSRGEKIIKQMRKANLIEVVQDQYHGHRINRVVAKVPANEQTFSESEHNIIIEVLQQYGRQTAAYLSELSHREPAWHYAGGFQKLSPSLMYYGVAENPLAL